MLKSTGVDKYVSTLPVAHEPYFNKIFFNVQATPFFNKTLIQYLCAVFCENNLNYKVLKNFLLILISLFFFSGLTTAGAVFGAQHSGIPEYFFEKDELTEVFSDDLIITRKLCREVSDKGVFPQYPDNDSELKSIYKNRDPFTYPYPVSTFRKQAICYGLLFLQQLF